MNFGERRYLWGGIAPLANMRSIFSAMRTLSKAMGPVQKADGVHHWVNEKYLQAHLDEICHRYNRRERSEGERVNDLLYRESGRLTYKALISAEMGLREASQDRYKFSRSS